MPSVRQRLFDEQRGRCAYCERKISLTGSDVVTTTRIEHFHPRSAVGGAFTKRCRDASGAPSGEQATVTWQNLLLCCSGESLNGATCDRKKASQDVCANFPNPKRTPPQVESLIEVEPSGRAIPRSGGPDEERQRIIDDVFGLNDEALVAARLTVRTAIARQIETRRRVRRGLPAGERRVIAARLRQQAETAEFGSVLLTVARRLEA